MNRIKNLVAVIAFSLLILALPAVASAQWRNDRNDNYGNSRYVESTIKNLKNRSKRFEKTISRELRNNRNDRYNRNDRLEDLAEDFRKATNRLDNKYDNRRYNSNSQEVRAVLQLGSQLDRALSRARVSYTAQNEWNQIRQDLRVIAEAYGYNNNRNRRNDRNWDWRDIFPF